jgi:hypothetical protein
MMLETISMDKTTSTQINNMAKIQTTEVINKTFTTNKTSSTNTISMEDSSSSNSNSSNINNKMLIMELISSNLDKISIMGVKCTTTKTMDNSTKVMATNIKNK